MLASFHSTLPMGLLTLKEIPQKLMGVGVKEDHLESDCSEDPTPPPWSLASARFNSSTPTSSSNAESRGVKKRSRVMFENLEPPERPPKRLRFVSPYN